MRSTPRNEGEGAGGTVAFPDEVALSTGKTGTGGTAAELLPLELLLAELLSADALLDALD